VALRSAWGGMARRVNSDGRSNKRAVHCAGENRLDILPIAVATISRTPHGENTDERGANACSDQRVPQQLSTGDRRFCSDKIRAASGGAEKARFAKPWTRRHLDRWPVPPRHEERAERQTVEGAKSTGISSNHFGA
jgi:hypothetical protein